jgi:hypothetical protein
MTAPALRTFANAGTEVSGDNLNTFEQTCNTFDDLRAFVGTTGQQVYARGNAAVNDGYGGVFYWDGSSTGTDDDLNIIAPTGQTEGRWLRCANLNSLYGSITNDTTLGDVADVFPGFDASESFALNKTPLSNILKNALTTMTAKSTPIAADTVMIGDSAASGEAKSATLTSLLSVFSAAASWPKGTLYGLGLSRITTTTYQVASGAATNEDAGTSYNMTFSSAFTKSLSAWAAGSANGSLDTGAVAVSTWYHVHLIRKDSDGTLDILLSTSVAAPTMPTGYTARRRIGSILTNGAAQIVAFSQLGDEFLWDVALVDVDDDNPTAAAVTRTLTTPLGVQVLALITGGTYAGTTINAAVFSPLDVSDQAPQVPVTAALSGFSNVGSSTVAGAAWTFMTLQIRTNTSSQIRSRLQASGAADRIGILTRGWIDNRGQ